MIKAAQLRRFYVVYTIVFSKKRAVVKKTLRMYFPALQIGIASKKITACFLTCVRFWKNVEILVQATALPKV